MRFFLRVTRRETKEEKEKSCHLLRDREGEVRLRVFFSQRFRTTFMSTVHIDEGSIGVGYLHCVWRWLGLLCPQKKKKNNQNYLPLHLGPQGMISEWDLSFFFLHFSDSWRMGSYFAGA